MFGDFNTPPSITEQIRKKKITKDIKDLNNTIKQHALT